MLPDKVLLQLERVGLPTGGECPFVPELVKNRKGEWMVQKQAVLYGPKKGKRGYVDTAGRIWVRDRAHSGLPDHWDVEEDGGRDYFRIDMHGNRLAIAKPDDASKPKS